MKDKDWSGLAASFKLQTVDNVLATVTLTANVLFWKDAHKALSGDEFGAWQVRAAIRDLIQQAEASFYSKVSPEDAPPSLSSTQSNG